MAKENEGGNRLCRRALFFFFFFFWMERIRTSSLGWSENGAAEEKMCYFLFYGITQKHPKFTPKIDKTLKTKVKLCTRMTINNLSFNAKSINGR